MGASLRWNNTKKFLKSKFLVISAMTTVLISRLYISIIYFQVKLVMTIILVPESKNFSNRLKMQLLAVQLVTGQLRAI